MSNPAIVLMTDPSRCSLGDVHYLLQALREMQHMGELAAPQAFCDHPAAAKDFLAAYTHAYPQLVLQDGAIPTPDHLQSLIANGQIGALGQSPAALAGQVPFDAPLRSPEQGASFPIVVLTLGSSQLLIDAMQQSPAMKDSIRLIDIVPEDPDSAPVSVAEAVANGGLEGDGAWEAEGARPELDEVAGASIRAAGGMTLDDDPLGLGGVETAEAPHGEAQTHPEEGEPEPATFQQAPADAPAPTVAAEPPAEPSAPEDAYEASTSAEPVSEQVSAVRPADTGLVAPQEATDLEQLPVAEEEAPHDDGSDDESAEADDEPGDEVDEDPEEPELVAERGVLDDDDVYYPPVGDLVAGSDVFYPALDQAAAPGVLQELVSMMLDDAIFDPDQAFEGLPPGDDLSPSRLREDLSMIRSSENVVTIEDLYGTFDHESEDVFADAGDARPSHDTDL